MRSRFTWMALCAALMAWSVVSCVEETEPETECDDGEDNDLDGLYDCDDPDCGGVGDCPGDDDDAGDDDVADDDDAADDDDDAADDDDDSGGDDDDSAAGDDDSAG
jgi:hypothetical protein